MICRRCWFAAGRPSCGDPEELSPRLYRLARSGGNPGCGVWREGPAIVAEIAANRLPNTTINASVANAFNGKPPVSIAEVAERMARLLGHPGEDPQLQHVLDSIGGPLNIERDQVEKLFNRAERNQLQALQQKVDAFKANSPAAPARAMV